MRRRCTTVVNRQHATITTEDTTVRATPATKEMDSTAMVSLQFGCISTLITGGLKRLGPLSTFCSRPPKILLQKLQVIVVFLYRLIVSYFLGLLGIRLSIASVHDHFHSNDACHTGFGLWESEGQCE